MSQRTLLKDIRREIRHFLRGDRYRNIPIDQMRCVDQYFARKKGYAGKPIECHPAYGFFQMALTDEARAEEAFREWLIESLDDIETWKTLESNSPRISGSLASIIEGLMTLEGMQFESIRSTPEELLDKAVRMRVRAYVQMFNSIRTDGFTKSWRVPVTCHRRDSEDGPLYVIKNGHHRVAALRVLGHEYVPAVVLGSKRGAISRQASCHRLQPPGRASTAP